MTYPVEISKESVTGPFFHGHVLVGTTAVKLTTSQPSILLRKGIIVRADSANTVDIYLGNAFVTADNVVGTGGLPIASGEAVFIPLDDPTLLYIRATVASQDLAWFAV